jgi:elongation factor Ts
VLWAPTSIWPAKNDLFKEVVKDISLQIAATNPQYISRDEVPAELIAKEKEILGSQIKDKPANVVAKIVEGKLEKFYSEICLLEQSFVKDGNIKIKDLVTNKIAQIGENILIRRFVRFQVGEEI